MYADRHLAAGQRGRTARDHGVDILLDAWTGAPTDRRAAAIAALGDLARAASYAGGGWQSILDGDIPAALKAAREATGAPGMAMLEAEALFAAGAVVAGLERLADLHADGDPAASVALVRRRHQLGDHAGAIRVAQEIPWHVHAALTGTRAALSAHRPGVAMRLLEPFLQGFAPVPEPAVAGAVAVTTATVLARFGEHAQLQRFVDRLIGAGDLAEDMMPAAARAAWIGGRAREAWHRFDNDSSPWCAAARLELAILAGDGELAGQLMARVGPLGAPSAPAVNLLRRDTPTELSPSGDPRLTESAREVFAAGRVVHVWRTHPHRWQPWIDAALATPASVVVCDLAAARVPDAQEMPAAVMDDGALVDVLQPVPVPPARAGTGVRIAGVLCRGVGVGHDWPDDEDRGVRAELPPGGEDAAVHVLDVDDALANAASGRPTVVVAPPGDPFWAGPLPERVWPALRVVRASPRVGWSGAAARVIAAVRELMPADARADTPH